VKLGEQLFLAFKSYGQAFRTLDNYRLWSIIVLPSILSLIIAIAVGLLAWITSDDILLYFIGKYSFKDFNSFPGNVFELLATVTVWGLTFFLYLKLLRYFILILLSPIFVNISNVLYKSVMGEEHKMNIWLYCFCSFRGIKFAIRNFILEILVTLALLLISIIILWILPLIPFFILIVESYFFAMVLMDYRFEMDGLKTNDTISKSRNLPGIPIGIGLIFNLILLVPLLGVVFGPVLAFLAAQESINSLDRPKSDDH